MTLIELIIGAVIVIIISGISIPVYNKSKEHFLGKEAVANLKLIAAAEKIYRMNNLSYVSCNCINSAKCAKPQSGCNAILKTNLNTQNWAYLVGVVSGSYEATASRQSGGYSDCTYTMRSSYDEPVPNSQCP